MAENTLIKGISINGVTHAIDFTSLENKPDAEAIGAQSTDNLVTTLSSDSTDTQYPSAKCVYDMIGDVETVLNTING